MSDPSESGLRLGMSGVRNDTRQKGLDRAVRAGEFYTVGVEEGEDEIGGL